MAKEKEKWYVLQYFGGDPSTITEDELDPDFSWHPYDKLFEAGRFKFVIRDGKPVILNGWLSGAYAFHYMGYPVPPFDGCTPQYQNSLTFHKLPVPTWDEIFEDPKETLRWYFLRKRGTCFWEGQPIYDPITEELRAALDQLYNAQLDALETIRQQKARGEYHLEEIPNPMKDIDPYPGTMLNYKFDGLPARDPRKDYIRTD